MLCAIQSHYDVSVLVQENSFSRFTACVLYIVLLTVYVFGNCKCQSLRSMLELSFSDDQDIYCFLSLSTNWTLLSLFWTGTFKGCSNLENLIGGKLTH